MDLDLGVRAGYWVSYHAPIFLLYFAIPPAKQDASARIAESSNAKFVGKFRILKERERERERGNIFRAFDSG